MTPKANKTPPRPTLQDVADRAGVSRTTASFVMNGREDMRISEAAQERVRRAARELDYRPNVMARSLKTRMTDTVALLSDAVATDGYAGDMVRACVETSIAAKHMLYIGEHEGDRYLRDQLIQGFLDRQVDGFLYAASTAREIVLPRELRDRSVVAINCLPRNAAVTAVVADDVDGGRRIGEHLVGLGHRSGIWILGETPAAKSVAVDRLRGIREGLDTAGVELAGTIECKWWPESAFEAMQSFLGSGRRPRAIVALNDRAAMGAYQAVKARGLRIPTDVSIVSFDDSPLARWLQPQLTSVAMPYHQMGVRAVELLLTGNDTDGIHRMPMPIHVRGSTTAPSS